MYIFRVLTYNSFDVDFKVHTIDTVLITLLILYYYY